MDALAGAAFPRAARLLQPDDFVRALKTRAHRGRYLWVYRRTDGVSSGSQAASVASAAPALALARPRLGLMIGKKNARTAVLRNAVKRRIREQFRLRQSGLPPTQYVVRLSASVSAKDVQAIIAEWTAALDHDIRKHARGQAPSGNAPAEVRP